ncbi:lysosomal-associated transmembrane protein 4A [Arctopsyche grandis]|uniref:lysosomal-associated transmembrane protein 4A n=1 Tax=Arctopsyche grandis TaxID=121162 RepID=UPI00406D8215
MLRLRPKLGSEHGEWRCCLCLHVRTGTIVLGVWHLLLHAAALVVLAVILREPELLKRLQNEGAIVPMGEEPPAPLPTPLSNIDHPAHPYTNHRPHSLVYHDVDMGALVTFCTLTINIMLVYGAVQGRPTHLLPFFCLQLFDFAITVLTATGYLCYLRSVHRLVAESRHVPWRNQLLQLSPTMLTFLVMFAFISAVVIKAYCINIVWRCYKYLTMRQHALRSLLPYPAMITGSQRVRSAGSPPAPGLTPAPLPDYEEALKQVPPPSYQMATAHLLEAPATPPLDNIAVSQPIARTTPAV